MRLLRVAPGLAALVAFFLPWVEGSGPLAGVAFSGYELAGYTGALRQLESVNHTLLVAAQAAIVLSAVAATWLAVLAWQGAWAPLRRACGGYIVLAGAILVLTGFAQGGPLAGALLMAVAGAGFATVEWAALLSRRVRRVPLVDRRGPGRDAPVAV